jgi:DNA-binding GntR family transcriptional regulator
MFADLQLEHSSTVDRAAEEIRRALFAGQIAPGTPLREVALSEAMGVGRSTIREALTVLVGEGVAVRVPNKGVAVKELTADDVHDVSLAREALEAAGVRRWPEATPSDRTAVRDSLERYARLAGDTSDPAALTEAHLQIHRALVGLTGSVRLVAAADALSAEIRLGLAHLDRTRANIADQVSEHRRLVGLVESGQVPVALDELAHHLYVAEVSLLNATGHGTIDS